MMNFEANNRPCDLTDYPIESPCYHFERRQHQAGGTSIICHLQTNCLVVINLNWPKDFVLNQAVENGSVDFTKEFSSIFSLFGYNYESIVVNDIAFDIRARAWLALMLRFSILSRIPLIPIPSTAVLF
jgi:hypothetical protein